MIARLVGRLVTREAEASVVDVGGVGYLVAATTGALRQAEGSSEVTVETYLHVREDVLQLYGFADATERELFIQLLSVNGVRTSTIRMVIVSSEPGTASNGNAAVDKVAISEVVVS